MTFSKENEIARATVGNQNDGFLYTWSISITSLLISVSIYRSLRSISSHLFISLNTNTFSENSRICAIFSFLLLVKYRWRFCNFQLNRKHFGKKYQVQELKTSGANATFLKRTVYSNRLSSKLFGFNEWFLLHNSKKGQKVCVVKLWIKQP